MFDLISKEEIRKIVIGLIGDLTVNYSYYEMSIILNVNEKTIYKWRSGYIPKADKFPHWEANNRRFHAVRVKGSRVAYEIIED